MLSKKIIERVEKLCDAFSHLPDHRAHQHLAFIFYKSRLISAGWNLSYKTHPLMRDKEFPFLHAEVMALAKARYFVNLKYCTLISIRIGIRNNWLLAKPCNICQSIINRYGIAKVYYSTNDGELLCLK